jgi:hypothetical protein
VNKVKRAQEHTPEGMTYVETRSSSLSMVSAFASLPTSLRNFWLFTSKLSKIRSDRRNGEPSWNPHILYFVFLALHFRPLEIQPGSRIRLQTQGSDLCIQILPPILQRPRFAAFLGNSFVKIRVFNFLASSVKAAFLLFNVAS